MKPIPRASLQGLLDQAFANREFWGEGVFLNAHDDHLYGTMKLFRGLDEEAVDSYMAYLDVEFVVKTLAANVPAHNIGWTLSIEGDEFGTIDDGVFLLI